ncbi:HipA domain-containing protein [Roseateles sp. P5_E4]
MDEDFGIYPEGKRAKEARFAPLEGNDPVIVPGRRYLFKRSRKAYPEQYWAEVIAYRVGCEMGIEVPPAFAAWNSETGICGALIEWFFTDGHEASVLGGDFLQKIHPDFDREKGSAHNFQDNANLMRALSIGAGLTTNWRHWWAGAVVFDALIGNTDRHQDNWSIVFGLANGKTTGCRLSPCFDNGTSLGSELDLSRVGGWSDEQLDRYIARGTHHIRWRAGTAPAELQRCTHIDLVQRVFALWPQVRGEIAELLDNLTPHQLEHVLADLMSMQLPVPLTAQRLKFVTRLLARRLPLLRAASSPP